MWKGIMGWILFYLFLLCKQSLGTKSDTVLCPVSEYTDDQEKTVKEFFECPRAEGNHFSYLNVRPISLISMFHTSRYF